MYGVSLSFLLHGWLDRQHFAWWVRLVFLEAQNTRFVGDEKGDEREKGLREGVLCI